MRVVVVLVLWWLAACTKHNPKACCVTDEQCQALGYDRHYNCADGLTCNPSGTCVPAQCSTSAD